MTVPAPYEGLEEMSKAELIKIIRKLEDITARMDTNITKYTVSFHKREMEMIRLKERIKASWIARIFIKLETDSDKF